MENRIVDTKEYVDILREFSDGGRAVTMKIAGNSMAPFLAHDRDYICFKRPDDKFRRGDMVFYQRENGKYVMHRIYKIKPEGYYLVGDAQTVIEGPVKECRIFAKIIKVKRKEKWIGPGNFWWEFFRRVWIRIVPLRRFVMKRYAVFSRLLHKRKGK